MIPRRRPRRQLGRRAGERLGQLRDQNMVLTWMNSIALNIHRSYIRREPLQTLPELSTSPKINLAAIDVRRILKVCKHNDRMVYNVITSRGRRSGDRAAAGLDGDGSSDPSASST